MAAQEPPPPPPHLPRQPPPLPRRRVIKMRSHAAPGSAPVINGREPAQNAVLNLGDILNCVFVIESLDSLSIFSSSFFFISFFVGFHFLLILPFVVILSQLFLLLLLLLRGRREGQAAPGPGERSAEIINS